jgi:hypothetical protein
MFLFCSFQDESIPFAGGVVEAAACLANMRR